MAQEHKLHLSSGCQHHFSMSCIHSAALGGHYHVVEFILSNGCKSVNLRDEDDETPLHLASKMGFINIVNLLMDNGADQALKNKDGVTAAMWAMTESQVDVVELLLDRAQRSGGKELAAVVNACDKVHTCHWCIFFYCCT